MKTRELVQNRIYEIDGDIIKLQNQLDGLCKKSEKIDYRRHERIQYKIDQLKKLLLTNKEILVFLDGLH